MKKVETSSRREPAHKNGSTATRWLNVFVGRTPSPLVSSFAFVKLGICLVANYYGITHKPFPRKIFSGAFFPIFVRKDFNKEIVDFPHLTERFELLTIVTFGEMIVSAGAYFTLESFGRHSVFVFSIIIMLFGCYVIHNHYMIDRHADTRGFMLMFSHYAMVIALNVITAATNLIAENEINGQTVTNMMLGASLLYFAGMFLNSVYYKRKLWTAAEKIAAGCALIAGAIVMIAMLSPKGCLIGMLVMSAGLFAVLLYKTKKQRIVCREAE